jgi:hypothetical protein
MHQFEGLEHLADVLDPESPALTVVEGAEVCAVDDHVSACRREDTSQ